jgi:predicted nucleotidyltransferase
MFEQERVLVRLQQRVAKEEDIHSCFLTGSYGRGDQDAYADLDVILVFSDEATRNRAFEHRQRFAQSVLPYVPAKSFDASHVRPYLHIALYANGSKVDYLYETKETLQPTPWIRSLRILKDSDGWGEQFQTLSVQQPPTIPRPTISTSELVAIDDRFWVMFMDIYRLLLRGDYHKPFDVYLQLLYFTLPKILALLPENDQSMQPLIRVYFDSNTEVTAAHLRELLTAFLNARDAVVRYHKLGFTPIGSFEREILRLVNKD